MRMCSHGLGDLVTVRQRNIEEDSFPEELHGKADALFLDLPRPWKVNSALKPPLAQLPSVPHASPRSEADARHLAALYLAGVGVQM